MCTIISDFWLHAQQRLQSVFKTADCIALRFPSVNVLSFWRQQFTGMLVNVCYCNCFGTMSYLLS